jgi:hypothetical protein
MDQQIAKPGRNALDVMVIREDVLQICYWYQGEGFGETFTPESLLPFLQSDVESVRAVMASLVEDGDLSRGGAAYAFTENGKRKAGRMFYESFTELQMPTHGECNAGCCDGETECDHDHDAH